VATDLLLSLFVILIGLMMILPEDYVAEIVMGPSRRQLDSPNFPDSFHAAVESALPATLPRSLVFTKGLWLHGVGDTIIEILAKLPAEDVGELKRQFVAEDLSGREPTDGVGLDPQYLLGRRLTYQEVEFEGRSQWGICHVLRAENEWHEVVFYTFGSGPSDAGDALNKAFLSDAATWPKL